MPGGLCYERKDIQGRGKRPRRQPVRHLHVQRWRGRVYIQDVRGATLRQHLYTEWSVLSCMQGRL
ncbi:hypothetical protein DPMN_077072 [Dreissena polymorpha]|uniref:Uncharacterized protein n=1 Tax=Dreissena polymorpha TaxID=45954 RepID=A0A9D3YP99_DREPO|nr:hypothetical protein DPMN_077072 [Dreissena polymorpha]